LKPIESYPELAQVGNADRSRRVNRARSARIIRSHDGASSELRGIPLFDRKLHAFG
jgi:hypothetical protein